LLQTSVYNKTRAGQTVYIAMLVIAAAALALATAFPTIEYFQTYSGKGSATASVKSQLTPEDRTVPADKTPVSSVIGENATTAPAESMAPATAPATAAPATTSPDTGAGK
jgi:hypothetical protein